MKEGSFRKHKLGLQETNYTKYIFCLQDKLAKKPSSSFYAGSAEQNKKIYLTTTTVAP
jgi:hypothetical protein